MTALARNWFQRFGTTEMPVRQSALNDIASQNGCPKRFFYKTEAELGGTAPPPRAHWRPCIGTAAHAVIETALTKAWPLLVQIFGPDAEKPEGASPGWAPANLRARIDERLREELEKAAGVDIDGKPQRIEWHEENPEGEIADAVSMVIGALRTTAERAESIVACEAPFRAALEGYELEGTVDLLYKRRGDGAICLADWKTGERKQPQVLLDYGYQLSTYAHALEHGVFWPGAENETRFGVWPAELHIVHLRDFVPYVKKPKTAGKNVGDLRGPGWCASKRSSTDVARLAASLRAVVGTVRMNRRLEALGEQCSRCPFRGPCLTDGHAVAGDEARALERALQGVDTSDADELSAA